MVLCLMPVKSNLDIVDQEKLRENQERAQTAAAGGMRFRKCDPLEKAVGIRFSRSSREKVEVEDKATAF